MKLKSYAKINLFLEIYDYIDPFHQIQSLITKIDLCDNIEILPTENFCLEINGPYKALINPENNIIIKVFDLMQKEFLINNKFHIKLEKNIPVSAGLGGGSSNAAEIILFLNKKFNLNLNKDQLRKIAIKIGADVSFFFENKPVIIEGFGEKIIEIPEDPINLNILLVSPNKELSTKDVFQNFKKNFFKKKKYNQNIQLKVFGNIKNYQNALEKSAITLMPEIKNILQEISQQDGCILSRMSGSGAACFGIFKNDKYLENAYRYLNFELNNYFVIKTKSY